MTERVGFFTDSSICIGCKACEVACKQWNMVPEDRLEFHASSYDNTGTLGANTWRHVAFIEEKRNGHTRWLMNSDVCKHCTEAACLEVCPTGAIMRTEFGTVLIQSDVCNGCGYCIPACPFGVIERREEDGMAHKCTHCYDRLEIGEEPACAKACPTQSISFGPVDELREKARRRVDTLHSQGVSEARLYGMEEDAPGVGGTGSIFLLLDEPETYGLPSDPVTPTRRAKQAWASAALAAAGFTLALVAAFTWRSR
jgi:formate dehydrogenase iron-sulfur subunit